MARAQDVAAGFGAQLVAHPQSYAVAGHFAGSDQERLAAFVELAADPAYDAIWFARGGYGSNRIAGAAVAALAGLSGQAAQAARAKRYMGYSDLGYMLGALYGAGIGLPVHGPMVADGRRIGGEAALARALAYLTGATDGLEPSLGSAPVAAFNLTTLAMLCGTPLMPNLAGHVVMVEEVSEHLYAVDRLFFHISAHLQGIAGIALGRVSDVPENDREFGQSATQIAQDWCARAGTAFLGHADIGHDAANKIVPFGGPPLAPRGQHQ